MNEEILSKIISNILRHNPLHYNISIDDEGWAKIIDVLNGIRNRHNEFANITKEDLLKMIEKSSKKRHEIQDEKIRAYYGHSFSVKKNITNCSPPEKLFHGTSLSNVHSIRQYGLKNMDRQFVHLSEIKEDVVIVAKRKSKDIVILAISALNAYNDGVEFYKEGSVWLTKNIDSKYISVIEH